MVDVLVQPGGPRHKLLYKMAVAYYEDDLTQDEIARRFGLSRVKVSRLLKQARQERIVRISLVPPAEDLPELERALEARYGLDEAVVVATPSGEAAAPARDLGRVAADCLVRGLQGDEIVAVGAGSLLGAVVDALPARRWPALRVVQMTGGAGRPERPEHGAVLARRMAAALGAQAVVMPAPGIVASHVVRNGLLADPQIAETLRLAAQAATAIVGIGSLADAEGLLSAVDAQRMRQRGAAGHIALRFFDTRGGPIDDEINDRIVGIELAQLTPMRRVIAVGSGREAWAAIRAAAGGRLFSVLVTDDKTAAALVGDGEDRVRGGPGDADDTEK